MPQKQTDQSNLPGYPGYPHQQQPPPPYSASPPGPGFAVPPGGVPPGAVPPGVYPGGVTGAGAPLVTVVRPIVVGFDPVNTTCPFCHNAITTQVETTPTTNTHLFALLLCLIAPICVCLPYCIPSCMMSMHYCPNCRQLLATHPNS